MTPTDTNQDLLITKLCTMLSDGAPHALRDLCALLNIPIGTLLQLRSKLPENIQSALKCDDLSWQLTRSFVAITPSDLTDFARTSEIEVLFEECCESTNTSLLNIVKNATPDTVFRHVLITNCQTAGRGRMERSWISSAGDTLTFSVALSTTKPQDQMTALPLVMALSCNRALNHFGIRSRIKWPNDVVIGDQKIAGILTETVKTENGTAVVIGVGMNFYPPQSADIQATGVWNIAPEIDPLALLKSLLYEIIRDATFYFVRGFGAFHIQYMSACRDLRREVIISRDGQTIDEGVMLGVDTQGALLLETSGSLKHIHSGDVSLRPQNHEDSEGSSIPPMAPHSAFKQMLILDCGNSQVKWAWVVNKEIVGVFRAPYNKLGILGEFCRQQPNISEAYGSTVSGELKKLQVTGMIPQRVRWFYSEKIACGMRNHYRHVEEHGSDRWFNAIGARTITDRACVVVSCGTAVTVDAVSTDNQYLGGSILPGFNLMKDALSDNTANLDRPFGRIYPFATTTPNAIASGILDAVIGAVLLMHSRLKEREENQPVDLILTGGGSSRIYQHLPEKFLAENKVKIVENLVIIGLLRRIEQPVEQTS